MINCFQFCSNFAYKFIMRRYTQDSTADVPFELVPYAAFELLEELLEGQVNAVPRVDAEVPSAAAAADAAAITDAITGAGGGRGAWGNGGGPSGHEGAAGAAALELTARPAVSPGRCCSPRYRMTTCNSTKRGF
jgi:hypothetical protein